MYHLRPSSDAEIYQSENPKDPRLGNLAKALKNYEQIKKDDFVVMGYPDDEGIYLNGGRTGAKEGPIGIRQVFYKLTPYSYQEKSLKLFDAGNLKISKDLGENHKNAKETAFELLRHGARLISLGGGHDYGYPDGAGFLGNFRDEKPLLINFDAHLDVRDTEKGYSSGTPFFRLLREYKDFEFWEIGIQSLCNAKEHLQFAKDHNVHILSLEELMDSNLSLLSYASERMGESLRSSRPCYLSICLDVFSSAYSPGCSQSWPLGLEPKEFFPFLSMLLQRLDVRLLGIYECSPPLDENLKSQRLASQILHRYIYSY